MTRREMLATMAAAALLQASAHAAAQSARFVTRGVILYPWDLSLADWPDRAAKAGINTIGLHAARRLDVLVEFVKSERGQEFLHTCRQFGVQVEYELHAMGDLLSRELYYRDTDLFRMDAAGQRNLDCNCCPSSHQALEIIAGKAVEYARVLKPATGHYYYWPDDGGAWCCCPKCKALTASDQATLVENAMAEALRKTVDPEAKVCHIAYHHTLEPPSQVKPHEGLFVEFAPISRRYDRSIADRDAPLGDGGPAPATHGGFLDVLDANLTAFGTHSAQVLEYWLDVSKFSDWKRPAKQLPWAPEILKEDADAYAARGIRHIKSFATWIDADYVQRFGEPPLAEYANILSEE